MSRGSQLVRIIDGLHNELVEWLTADQGVEVQLRTKPEDKLRLLKLRTWSMRYWLPVSEILGIVVPKMRFHMNKHMQHSGKQKNNRWALGVTIPVLTGKVAEQLLVAELKRLYPSNEHVTMAKRRLQEQQLEAERDLQDELPVRHRSRSLIEVGDVHTYVAEYKRHVAKARQAAVFNRAMRAQKPYRSNPWR